MGELVRLLDRDGQITETDCCPNCEQHQNDLANAEEDLRKARRRIKVLLADKERERQLYAHRTTVLEHFEFWQAVTGHTKSKLDGARFDAIAWAIEQGYEDWQIRLAIIGAGVDAFVDKGGTVHDKVTLIFREADKFEAFVNRGYKWGQRWVA